MRGYWIGRVLSWIGLIVVGAVFGLACTITHASKIGPVPVGIVVAIIACAALLVAVRSLMQDRWAALAAGIGMLGAVVVISGAGPGGSVIVPNDLLGQIWTYVVAGMVVLVVAWPDLSRLRAASAAAAARAEDRGPSGS